MHLSSKLLKSFSVFIILTFVLAGIEPFFVSAQTPSEEKEILEQELADLEKQIESIEGDITKTQEQKASLQRELSVLKSKIRKLDLQISQSNKIIGDLRNLDIVVGCV